MIKLYLIKNIRIYIFISFCLCFCQNVLAQRDLPNPSPNYELIPAGSFIIPMDNIYQSIVPAGQAPFNLKSYGLVYKLLQAGIHVKWAIKAGKEQGEIDFSAMSEGFSPNFIPASMLDFRGGPFI